MESAATSTVLEITQCFFYSLANHTRTLIEVGPFKLSKLNDDPDVTFFQVNTFSYQLPPKGYILKIDFNKTVSYIFEYDEGGLYAFVFRNTSEELAELDEQLK